MNRMTSLKLIATGISDAGLKDLPKTLRFLDIRTTAVTDAGLKNLRGLVRLEFLSLRGTQVTDQSMPYLGTLAAIRELDLRATQVGDGGVVDLRRLTCLQNLDLRQTLVTDVGLEHLAAITGLKWLGLACGTSVSADGVETLKSLLPNCVVVYQPTLPAALRPASVVQSTINRHRGADLGTEVLTGRGVDLVDFSQQERAPPVCSY